MAEHLDVLIVGAGLSGVGMAYHLQTRCPDRSYAIVEAREGMGGTWDLFRYPGVRSDSDMHTLGFSFRPWREAKAIADGPSILRYIRATAAEYGIDQRIRYNRRVVTADWSSADARWTVALDGPNGRETITCSFLCMCAGYYDYAEGHAPVFPGADRFGGRIVHPQFWPEDLDHAGARVVVIGSGATAVTLVPELAREAAHVTMLQRSPSYVVSRPAEDRVANWMARHLPEALAYRLTRWKNVLLGMLFFQLSRRRPERVRQRIIAMVRDALGPGYDVGTHFTPSYKPWDQRVCLVPDADLFTAIRDGRAEVVTNRIETFTERGLRLASGRELTADVVVTATGLKVKLLGGAAVSVDGAPVSFADRLQYKGVMFADVPNLASVFGYTNASWTLKADLVATYVCRLLNTMRKRSLRQVTPHPVDPAMASEPIVAFTSGYIQRAAHLLPRQGRRKPWRLAQNYLADLLMLRFGRLDDEMTFSNPEPAVSPELA